MCMCRQAGTRLIAINTTFNSRHPIYNHRHLFRLNIFRSVRSSAKRTRTGVYIKYISLHHKYVSQPSISRVLCGGAIYSAE